MSKNQQRISGPMLAAALFGGSFLVRKGIEKAWPKITDKPLPSEQDNAEVELADAVKWAVVSGVAGGLLKLAIRRANYKGSPLK